MAKVELLRGSWHNAGYHGHFRSKSRSDFLCEYRHLAKPVPPGKFITRAKETPARHAFSHHDNRNAFTDDALYFEQGMGRRRIRNNTNRYQNDLLMWLPDKVTFERGDPKMSVYKVDYPIIPGTDNVKQRITRRPKTSFDDDRMNTTSYRYAHSGDNPNRGTISAMTNCGLSTVTSRKQKASFISGRESVATCLNWHVPTRSRSIVPAATQTQEVHTGVSNGNTTGGTLEMATGTANSECRQTSVNNETVQSTGCTHTTVEQVVDA